MLTTEDIIQGIVIAIVPFENLTKGEDLHYFCEAFTLELITELSRFHQFQIIAYKSTTSVGSDKNPNHISLRSLHSDYTVSGSFHQLNDHLSITVQLANTQTEILVWAERFEGFLDQVSSIRDDLLLKIVFSLQQQIDHDLLTYIRKRPQDDFKAYSHWLRGLVEVKKGSHEADLRAREYFHEAMTIDPAYGRAYTGMSLTYFNEWSCQLWDRWEVSQNGAFEWAQKAVELDEWDYLSATILGKVYLYKGDFDKAEYFLRKSLHLNPNDADNLILIASCMVYLGYLDEANQLYTKASLFNPLGCDPYYVTGAFIMFEMGKFKEAIALVSDNRFGENYVDYMAFVAAAYYAVGDFERMEESWQNYLREFSIKINKGKPADNATALQWMINVNPYKGSTNLKPFWDYMGQQQILVTEIDQSVKSMRVINNGFSLEGDYWRLAFEGKFIQVPDLKGLHDLEKLLEQPHTPIHCTALIGAALSEKGEEVFDEKAKSDYQRRILELQQDIEEAAEFNDSGRIAELREEYDQLLDHLSSSVGLGQKTRKIASGAEKARTAVTWRIRHAIKKIDEVHPKLAKHLDVSVKTGLFCVYSPENEVNWR